MTSSAMVGLAPIPLGRAALVALLLVLCASAAPAGAAAALPPAKAARIDELVAAYLAKNQVPGLSIAVVADGALAWTNAYGLADVENAVPARPSTRYRSASIGKVLTATAAMRLVEEGRLDLDADARRYCTAFPAKRWPVTARHLLSHTSGIRHYGGPNDRAEQLSTVHYATVPESLAPFRDDPLEFEPGTRWGYSTYGYGVLGCAMEGAAGVPFLEVMRTRVFAPAGMAATRDDDPAAIVAERAANYSLVDGDIRNAPAIDMSNRLAAGGYLTTVVDLARFVEALLAGRLVRPATFESMTRPTVLASGERVPYGFGWGLELEQWHDDDWVFHGGSSPGASGFLAVMARHRFGVVFLANRDGLPERSELAAEIARVVLDFGAPAATAPPDGP